MTRPLEGVPSDNTTLRAVLDAYAAAGYSCVFEVLDGGDVCCAGCDRTSPADSVAMHSIRRLEGASDPADMLAVCAVRCPNCGARGTVVVGFGPAASGADADFLTRAPDVRGEDVLPPNSPVAEAASDSVD